MKKAHLDHLTTTLMVWNEHTDLFFDGPIKQTLKRTSSLSILNTTEL